MPLRILLADDHRVIQEGLRALLESRGFAVVAGASNGEEAVRLCEKLRPDVAVVDFSMPVMNGVVAATEIQRVSPQTATIMLSMHGEDQYVLEALRAGVKGYILKTSVADELVSAIRQVSAGSVYVSPHISGALVRAIQSPAEVPKEPLSIRERQVLQLVAEGKTSKEVAKTLGISRKTVESHRTRIMEKLAIHDMPGLIRYAIRRGLITPCFIAALMAFQLPGTPGFWLA